MMTSLHLLVLGALALSTILPGIVFFYGKWHLPKRWDEIRGQLTEELSTDYVSLFAPARVEGKTDFEFVKGRFDTFYSWERYLVPIVLAWTLQVVGLLVCAFWIEASCFSPQENGIQCIPAPIIFSILGGLVWSTFELFNRRNSADLTPDCLYEIGFRLLACVPIGYAMSLLSFDKVPSFFAFAASAFPVKDLRLMLRRRVLNQLKMQGSEKLAAEEHLGQQISGLSSDTLARLDEISIRTPLDLAYADPLKIFIETGFPVRCVVDWIDQSLLALYVKRKIRDLEVRGIRGALEARLFYEEHCLDKHENRKAKIATDSEVKELATALGTSPTSLLRMLDQISYDPHVMFISKLWGEVDNEEQEHD